MLLLFYRLVPRLTRASLEPHADETGDLDRSVTQGHNADTVPPYTLTGQKMLRSLIYRLKRLVHDWPGLYRALYGIATFNLDYARQLLQLSRYPSKFGGMWTDRDDFQAQAARRSLTSSQLEQLDSWREQGFVSLPQAVDHSLIDRYLQELESLKDRSPSPLLITAASTPDPVPYTGASAHAHTSVRVVDDYFFSPASREILFADPITDFLRLVFDQYPELNQSLSFYRGSEQDIHQDTAFVRMNAPMKLAAVWVALEDVQAGSGELLYYPGSHRWEDYLFSGYFKHYDEERDGEAQLQHWYEWIHQQGRAHGSTLTSILPRKGDVFIWHAGLAHGGAAISRPGSTRRSLVGHYCPRGVRPLYHYYKPAQRAYQSHADYRYCSSYYR